MPEIQKIKEALEAKLERLENRVDEIEDDLSEPQEDDAAERATESSGDETLEALGAISEDEINRIKLALAKIASGDYGVCTNCESKIAIKRLEAMPHATKCIKCA